MSSPAGTGAGRILVVDDEPQNRKLLEALLDVAGYVTSTAATGEQALAAVAADPPDLILLDVMMPGMDGYEVARVLKSEPATANIPIVMLSALGDRDARVTGLDAGAEDYLSKPVDRAELWLRVRNLLRLKNISDRLQTQSSALQQQARARIADLHQLEHYDALTGLANRAFLYETLRESLGIAAAQGWVVAVMVVDVDEYKAVNDRLGFATGDALLTQFGARLVECVRVGDTVGRLGGDEFAVIVTLEAGQHETAAVVAGKVSDATHAPFLVNGHEVQVSASIGIAVYPHDGDDADTLLRNADTAMYRAKQVGRDSCLFFRATMDEQMTARHQVESAARRLASHGSHDGLTLLPSRERLLELLAETPADASPSLGPRGAACLGVDRLKHVNDSHGYAVGDELLQRIATRMAGQLRDGDVLARLAGDEFVVTWPDVGSEAEARALAGRLAAVFAEPFLLAEGTVELTASASIGIAIGGAQQSGEELLLSASAAMRDAKRHGPGRTAVHTSQLQQAAQDRIRIEAEIRAGIVGSEFVLHYQPVVDLQTCTVAGVEALVRWDHPDGLRMPDGFIPVAEQSGLIVPLGAWVLDEACQQAAQWSTAGLDVHMAVNLSARQVAEPGMAAMVEAALNRAALPPNRLLLEITESAVIEDAELALTALHSLDALGTGLAIDDFGTGYSSLLYLKRYPIHTLKIDRSFVAGMGINRDDDAIVASIVSLARAVGASCTAEGVETAAQAAALRALGCQYAQGYFFSRPVPAAGIGQAIAECEQRGQLPALVAPGELTPSAPVPLSVIERMGQLHLGGASLLTIAAALNQDPAEPGTMRWSSKSVRLALLAHDAQPDARALSTSQR